MSRNNSDKDRWRRVFRQRRRRIFPRQRTWKSQQLVDQVSAWEKFRAAQRVLLFYPVGKEINPLGLIHRRPRTSKTWVFPRVQKESCQLKFYAVSDPEAQLARGAYDLMEPLPEKTREISPAELDLAFVPGLVFDRAGYRLGFGGGFYDKFLGAVPALESAGLCYEFQKVGEVPRGEHDVAVDYLGSEAGVVRCESASRASPVD